MHSQEQHNETATLQAKSFSIPLSKLLEYPTNAPSEEALKLFKEALCVIHRKKMKLERELENHLNTIEDLKNRMYQREKEKSNYSEVMNSLETRLAELATAREKSEKELLFTRKELEELQNSHLALEEKTEEIQREKEDIARQRDNLAQTVQEKKSLEEKCRTLDEANALLTCEIEGLRGKYEEAANVIRELGNEVKDLKNNLRQSSQYTERLKKELETTAAEKQCVLAELSAEKETVRAELDEAHKSLKNLSSMKNLLSVMQDKQIKAQRKIENFVHEIACIREQKDRLSLELLKTRQRLEEEKKSVEKTLVPSLEKRIRDLRGRERNALEKAAALERAVCSLNEEKAGLSGEMERLGRELEDARRRAEANSDRQEISARLAEMRERYEKANSRAEDLVKKLKSVTEEKERSCAELAELRNALADSEAERQLVRDIPMLRRQLERAVRKQKSAEERIKKLARQSYYLVEEKNKLKEIAKDWEEKAERSRSELASRNGEIFELKRIVLMVEKDLKTSTEKRGALEEELARLKKEQLTSKKELSMFTEKVIELHQTKTLLEKSLAGTQEDKKQLLAHLDDSRKELASVRSEKEEVKKDLEKKCDILSRTEKMLRDQEQTIAGLDKELAVTKKELEAKATQLLEKEEIMERLKAELVSANLAADEMKNAIDRLKRELEGEKISSAELRKWKDYFEGRALELDAVHRHLKKKEIDLDYVSSKKMKAEARIRSLAKALKRTEEEKARIEKALQEKESLADAHQRRILDFGKKITTFNTTIQDLEKNYIYDLEILKGLKESLKLSHDKQLSLEKELASVRGRSQEELLDRERKIQDSLLQVNRLLREREDVRNRISRYDVEKKRLEKKFKSFRDHLYSKIKAGRDYQKKIAALQHAIEKLRKEREELRRNLAEQRPAASGEN